MKISTALVILSASLWAVSVYHLMSSSNVDAMRFSMMSVVSSFMAVMVIRRGK